MTRSLVLAAGLLFGVMDALNLKVSVSGGVKSSPLMYGIMFEDINYSGDGGLYAELIRNRAFQGASSTEPFAAIGGAKLSLTTAQPLSSALPRAMTVTGGTGEVGFSNPGWWGMDVKAQPYKGSFYVRGDYSGKFTASFLSSTKAVLGSAEIESSSNAGTWTKHSFTIVPTQAASNSNNTFRVTYDASAPQTGSLSFNLISVFPPTYKDRPNGLRKDLMEALGGMKPSFLRFPGGNNIEGQRPADHWKWQNTVGFLTERPGRSGDWGYFNTDGLGLIEYMQWCEDLDIEPILAIPSGLYLKGAVVSQTSLQPFVDDFLNELEFLTGDVSTKYGALRAKLGFARPWRINFVEIGNEDNLNGGSNSYTGYRFNSFYTAIRAKYPNMTVIASFEATGLPAEAAQDYHIYDRPNRLIGGFNKFDKYDRKKKVLIGEYANIDKDTAGNPGIDWGSSRPTYPWWRGAVSEAVFMLGAERNGDVVIGASYAPLFSNINSMQWKPDLIAFTADPEQTVVSTSYAGIKLFSTTRITTILSVTPAPAKPVYFVAGTNAVAGSHVLKAAVYDSGEAVPMRVAFDGLKSGATAALTVLTAAGANAINEVGKEAVKTDKKTLTADGDGVFVFSLPDMSISVLEASQSG